MKLSETEIEKQIRQKLIEIVAQTGQDASGIEPSDIIPATGLVDSAALLELLAWYEKQYDMELKSEEITIDNLGSISLMAAYVLKQTS